MNREDLIQREIELAEDECCIVFDFGCHFPYKNTEVLIFGFALGMEEINDFKLNSRYPNKNWVTISKKDGRKVSKLGYPYVMKLNEQSPMVLAIKVGIKEQDVVTLAFCLETNMTKEKPACLLRLAYDFEKSAFCLSSYEEGEGVGSIPHCWYNNDAGKALKAMEFPNDIMLEVSQADPQALTVVYKDLVTAYPCALEDLPVQFI